MRAIVIDDSRAMRGILKRVLLGMTFEIIEAADGKDGLAKLIASQVVPDLALVDWNMPNMNGLEFVKAARANHRFNSMLIMMVTTEVEMSQLQLALSAGANEYMMKPFTEDAMRDKIEMLGISREAA